MSPTAAKDDRFARPDTRRRSAPAPWARALSIFALITGLITGFGAIFFRGLIAVIHNLFFLGTFSASLRRQYFHARRAVGPFIILAPVIGGLVVTALVTNFAPEARGHGVPEVMDAIYYQRRRDPADRRRR